MTDNFQTRGQYRAAAQTIRDTLDNFRTGNITVPELQVQANLGVALAELAVAEAMHRVAAVLEQDTPVVVDSTGTVTIDPDAVAAAINKILRSKP